MLSPRIQHQVWANGIRSYTNEVRLRGLNASQVKVLEPALEGESKCS